MSMITNSEPGLRIPGTSSHFLDPTGSRDQGQGRLRYLTGDRSPAPSSPRSGTPATSSSWNGLTCQPTCWTRSR